MNDGDESLNPYASPQVPQQVAQVPGEPCLGLYQPRLAPRDATDVFLLLGLGVPGAVLVYGLPLGLIVLLRAPAVLMPIAVLSIAAAAILALLLGIQRIIVTPERIVAQRWILPAVEMDWSQIVSIRELTRGEALRVALVAPSRYCSHSLTYLQHFRVETRTTYFVFPPRDVVMFCTTIQSLWSESRPPGRIPVIMPDGEKTGAK